MTTDTFTLTAATAIEVRAARRALMHWLDGWACGRTSDAMLVFSELATNAVKHAGGVAGIRVVHGDHRLHFEIHDQEHAAPVVRTSGGAEGGFGLRIVEQLSAGWGWTQTATGKIVWADLPCCTDEPD